MFRKSKTVLVSFILIQQKISRLGDFLPFRWINISQLKTLYMKTEWFCSQRNWKTSNNYLLLNPVYMIDFIENCILFTIQCNFEQFFILLLLQCVYSASSRLSPSWWKDQTKLWHGQTVLGWLVCWRLVVGWVVVVGLLVAWLVGAC